MKNVNRFILQFFLLPPFLFIFVVAYFGLIQTAMAEEKAIKENQGYVIGSIIVTVPETGEKSFLRGGRKLTKMKWAFEIDKVKGFSFGKSIKVKPNEERHFLKKLKGGKYRISRMNALGFANFYIDLRIPPFVVEPKQTTYFGKIIVSLPYRAELGTRAKIRIVDNFDKTIEALNKEHPDAVTNVKRGEAIARITAQALPHASGPKYPFINVPIGKSSINVQAVIMKRKRELLFWQNVGKLQFPSRYVVILTNNTKKPIWTSVTFYFSKFQKKPTEKNIVKSHKIEPGKKYFLVKNKFGTISGRDIPIKIVVYSDVTRKNIIKENNLFLFISKKDKEHFYESFSYDSQTVIPILKNAVLSSNTPSSNSNAQ